MLVLLSRLPAGAVDPWALAGTLGAGAETTGIVSAAAFGLAASSVAGVALAYLAAFFMPHRGTRPERGNGMRRKMFILPHERITPEKEAGIRSCLSFLSQRRRDIHSIVLVGSAAYGADVNGSDIDVVVICGDRGHEAVLEIVCERELAESLQGEQERKYEYTVLSASQAEEQFRMASPFAQSIRHGVVLADDGYLRSLFNAGHPQRPGRQYVMTALSDTITVQYYGSLEALKKRGKSAAAPIPAA